MIMSAKTVDAPMDPIAEDLRHRSAGQRAERTLGGIGAAPNP